VLEEGRLDGRQDYVKNVLRKAAFCKRERLHIPIARIEAFTTSRGINARLRQRALGPFYASDRLGARAQLLLDE